MRQRRRLQRMTWGRLAHPAPREHPQLVIHQRKQRGDSMRIPVRRVFEQQGHSLSTCFGRFFHFF